MPDSVTNPEPQPEMSTETSIKTSAVTGAAMSTEASVKAEAETTPTKESTATPQPIATLPLTVRYKRSLAVTLLVSGSAILLSSLLQYLQGDFPIALLASAVFLGAGGLLWRNTYFRLDRHEILVYKPMGSEDYRCNLKSLRDLSFADDGETVYLTQRGEARKMPLYAWLADANEWSMFVAIVEAKHAASGQTRE